MHRSKIVHSLVISSLLFLLGVAHTATAQEASMAKMSTLMLRFQKEVKASKFEEAAATAAELLPIAERFMGKNNPDVARMGITRGVLLRNAGKYDDAKRQLKDSVRDARARLGAQHPVTASALNTLGSVHKLQGEHGEAKKLYQQSIAILEKLGDESISDKLEVYANYSDLLAETGEPLEALKYTQQALAMSNRKFGTDHERTATLMNNLGLQLLSLAAMDESEKMLRASLVLHTRIYGQGHLEIASSLNNLGKLLIARGKYDEAEASLKKALDIYGKQTGVDPAGKLSVQNNLGLLYSEIGDSQKALPLLEETLKRKIETLGENHPSTALAQHNLGSLLLGRKEYAKAKPLLTSAVKYFESDESNRLADSAASMSYLGILEANIGDTSAAIEQFDASRRRANDAAWHVLPGLGSKAQQRFMVKTFNGTLNPALSLGFVFPNKQEVLDSTAEWLANGKGIAAEALVAARRKKTNVPLTWVTLDEIRNALPDKGIWIDIARQDVIDFEGASYEERLQDPRYVAWIVPRAGAVVRVELGDAAEIDELVNAVREMMSKASGEGGAITEAGEIESTKQAKEQLAAVAGRVLNPLTAKLPDDTKKIFLSPDGALWLLPWAALPVNDENVLIQDYALSTFGSGRDLLKKKQTPPAAVSPTAIFSDPDFDQDIQEKRRAYSAVFRRSPSPALPTRSIAAFDPGKFRATPLPGTAMEAAAILPSVTKWLSGQEPVQYRGKYAMESIAKKTVSPRSLVFATHGFFSDDAEQSFDPLQRCGLLLCGCNDPKASTLGDDGVLTGAEIAEIDLKGTELVVLSACETGIGRIENGNGVAGLRRSFHMAGAETVVSTLWQIPDLDTAKLMSDFFAAIAEGMPKDEALQQAQIKRIESRNARNGAAHPFFWAGFTISGR